ncbi:MAG: SusC/RagA family TonB-linked outer membrane protein, partial [Bacteroidales bacterium]|nr:SusC/RagA family TonB-linked outer membrane protein [Bacteroidales bacterium]
GFGTQKKENLTGAVASVNVSKALESRPIADVGRGLQGMTPGLNVRVGSSEVGADALIRIRGQVGSYNGSSEPLILLDNVEIPSISMVNPDDIESISVLKDAASSAIYGAKAAFGVILITSKKGAKTETVNVTYSGNFSFQNMAEKYEMADVDGLHYTVEAAERIGTYTPTGAFWLIDRAGYNAAVAWKEKYADLDPMSPLTYGRDWYLDGSNRKIGVRTYDPYEYLVRNNAPTMTHNLSVAGKSGNTNYNISLGYLDQSGMMKTTDYDKYSRYNANVRLSTKVNDWVSVHAGLMFSKTEKNWSYATNSTTADIWYYLYRWGSTYPLVPQDEYGNPLRNGTVETANGNKASRTNKYSSANAGITVTPLKDWNIDFDYTYANNEEVYLYPGTRHTGGDLWSAPATYPDEHTVSNEWAQFNQLGSTLVAKYFRPIDYTGATATLNSIYRDAYTSERQTYNLKTTYDLTIAENHKFNFMLGMQAVDYEQVGNWSRKIGLMDINNPQFDLATGTQTSGGGHTWNSQLGFFGRINYNYKEKYLLEANLRYDGTSKFPGDLKWRWFPSFSAGWRVTEEPWMEGAKDVLSSLKVRGSWGSIGDQSVSNSLYIPTMTLTNSTWIHDGAKDVYYTTPAAVASDITWQEIQTLGFGIDAQLFNKIGITFDWFERKTKNMIVGAEGLGIGFGTTAPNGNYGDLSTRGWELSLDYGHVFESGFSINVTAGVADAKTTIDRYGSATSITGWYNGKTYGEIWGFEVDRLFTKDDFVYDASGNLVKTTSTDGYTVYQFSDPNMATQGYLNSGSLIFGPGDVKYKDLNGDGVINKGNSSIENHGDLKVVGNTTPRYEYNFRVDLAYKGFDFSAFFQGVGQRDMWGSSSMTLPGFNSSDGAMAQAFAGDFWYETIVDGKVVDANYDAFYPRAANCAGSSIFNMQTSDRYLLDMSYLRLKNVTLGYSLPEKLLKKAYINKLRIYVSLENFLTFDNLNGLPIDVEEVSGYSSFNSSNYNSSRAGVGAPAFKSASFGVQLTF